jgi:hypothetical protein
MPELPLQCNPGFRRAPLDDAGGLRDDPTASFIEQIRVVLPTEREIDAMLTRKMRRRRDRVPGSASLEQMTGM